METEPVTALEALGIAIRAEIDAAEVYTELAARIGNPFLQQKILTLAKEEQQHRRILEEAYRSQFQEVPLALPDSRLAAEFSTPTLRDQLSVKEVLALAITHERQSREFYLEAAASTTDLSGKRMFNYLADWEFSHQMELTAEHDMIMRYPRFFEQSAEPWKAEFRR